MYPYIIQGNNISIVIDNQSHSISKTHIAFEKIKTAIKEDNWDLVRDLIEPKQVIIKYGSGNVSVENGEVFWKGNVLHNALTKRMMAMLEEGFSIEPLVAFMENLMQNPSYRAVNELYSFLEHNNLPITPDGYFLAYKKVRDTFFDIHSNTMDNSPGKIVEMDRNLVDDDQNNTCSKGLHFCSQEYLNHFGDSKSRTVILKINPKDVVSIPVDYNNSKGRACRYEVIGELNVAPDAAFTKPVQATANTQLDLTKQEISSTPWLSWPHPKA